MSEIKAARYADKKMREQSLTEITPTNSGVEEYSELLNELLSGTCHGPERALRLVSVECCEDSAALIQSQQAEIVNLTNQRDCFKESILKIIKSLPE